MDVRYFAVELKKVMKEDGVSIAELSRRSGVPYATLYDLMSGRTSPERIAVDTAIAVTSALGTTVEEVLGEPKKRPEHVTPDERELLALYRSMSSDGREVILSAARGIAASFPSERAQTETAIA